MQVNTYLQPIRMRKLVKLSVFLCNKVKRPLYHSNPLRKNLVFAHLHMTDFKCTFYLHFSALLHDFCIFQIFYNEYALF